MFGTLLQLGSSHNMWLLALLALIVVRHNTACAAATLAVDDSDAELLNDRPIIGVLALDMSYHLDGKWPGEYHSYIASSYVKFVEGGGARVIPIWIDRPSSYYEDILTKINGVLMPGGALWFNQTGGYVDAGRQIYAIAKRMNDAGHVMPVWGTCLGIELMLYLDSPLGDPRSTCSSDRQALHLDFEPDYRTSRMFGTAPEDIVQILATEPVTANFHSYCFTREDLAKFQLAADWRVLSVNKDWNGLEFVSTMEHTRYPFYGVQFHPEKVLYEWIANRNITKTTNATRANQYFASFFVDQSRRSFNRFAGGVNEENSVLIYNYPTNFTALVLSAYTQCYLFAKDVDYK